MRTSTVPTPRGRRRVTPKATRLLIPLLAAALSGPAMAVPAMAVPAAVDPAVQGGSGNPSSYLTFHPRPGTFPLVADGRAVPLVVSSSDYVGVRRAAGDLRTDLKRATDVEPALVVDDVPRGDIVLIGTIGRSPLID